MIYAATIFALFVLFGVHQNAREKSLRRRILRILAFAERPMSGRDLRPLLDVPIVGMYWALDALEKEELIWGEDADGGPDRNFKSQRFFRLTTRGRGEAQKFPL